MWRIKYLICVLLFVSCNGIRRCSDCNFINLCSEALIYQEIIITDEIKKMILRAYCGDEEMQGQNRPKVCCSDFLRLEPPEMPQNLASRSSFHSELLPIECGRFDGRRIVGGNIPYLRQFPWMALIAFRARYVRQERDKFKCGGTIINSRYIMTAAHCVVKKLVSKIRLGEFEIGKDVDRQGEYPHIDYEDHLQEVGIEEIISHENYNYRTKKNDIALIRVNETIDFSFRNVAPVCLPVQEELRQIKLGKKTATIAGWGVTENDTLSNILMKVEVPIYQDANCRQYDDALTGDFKKICAGAPGKDSCSGDSGGPLMLEEVVNGMVKIVQYGIVSHGPLDCTSSSPGIYTNVAKYMEWILEKIKP